MAAHGVQDAERAGVGRPGLHDQAEDRCHRIGQTDSVLVQHLVLEGSLDAEMAVRLIKKQAVIDAAPRLTAQGIQVLHAVGGRNDDQRPGAGIGPAPYVAVPYIDRMDLAYAAADLVVDPAHGLPVPEPGDGSARVVVTRAEHVSGADDHVLRDQVPHEPLRRKFGRIFRFFCSHFYLVATFQNCFIQAF